MKSGQRFSSLLLWLLLPHALVSWFILPWSSSPALVVEMTSNAASYAQVYFDRGEGLNESDSATLPVSAGEGLQTLRFDLPAATVRSLRFDPLNTPGEVVLHKVQILSADGSVAASFSPNQIHANQQFDRREDFSSGIRLHVSPPNTDPQLGLDLAAPLKLSQRFPSGATLLKLLLGNVLLFAFECVCIFAPWRRPGRKTLAFLLVHTAASALMLYIWSSPPMVEVEMASSIASRAQLYWDIGAGMSEAQSSSQPVRLSPTPQLLRLPLPHGVIRSLRFDPINSPGTIVIKRAAVLNSDGSVALPVDPHRIRGIIGFDQEELQPAGLRFRIRTDSYDPQLSFDLNSPLDLTSRFPGDALLLRVAKWNLVLLACELVFLGFLPRLATQVSSLAAALSSDRFIVFDSLAIWFYLCCLILYFAAVLANLNGSSMDVLWSNFRAGAPADLVAGTPKPIRADEFNFQTPTILNQVFRATPFAVADTPPGHHSAGLLAELPLRHITTWFRPQYWPFFVLPPDYAFSAWWQAKGLIMATGVFTLLLLLTQSSGLALAGTLWLLFSQFTQWCYTWPSMLPEMAGLLCFSVVFFLYLTVGRNRAPLLLSAVAAAVCAVDFAFSGYVPHLVPYAWAGLIVTAAWCFAHWNEIAMDGSRTRRIAALILCFGLTGGAMYKLFHDASAAIAGIAATTYPGHRILSGGGYSIAAFATHFLAASESAERFPPGYYNINESAGFLWLAPVTLFAWSRLRGLPRASRIVLGSLWVAAMLLFIWMVAPVPASIGHWLLLDRVPGVRCVPALGLLNVAIVMLALTAPPKSSRLSWPVLFALATLATLLSLYIANRGIQSYFHFSELLLGAVWAGWAIASLLRGHRAAFAAAVVLPNVLLFGLVNPVQRGIATITDNPLFEIVHKDARLRQGKWLVLSQQFPSAIFIAAGCDVYNGMRILPDQDDFPLLADSGVDTNILNNGGYLNIDLLQPGQAPRATAGPYGPVLGISPIDPLVQRLGIRYLAFHEVPPPIVLDRLKPLIEGSVSEFFLYEFK